MSWGMKNLVAGLTGGSKPAGHPSLIESAYFKEKEVSRIAENISYHEGRIKESTEELERLRKLLPYAKNELQLEVMKIKGEL